MKGGAKANGFTIVETLIVLAVTGALFLSAAALINGKEARTEFTQSIQSVQSQLQETINEVQSGYYPSEGNFTCSAASGVLQFTNSRNGQGTNKGCVFIGKVIAFLPASGNNDQQFQIYTVVGLQKDSSGAEVSSLNDATAVVLAPNSVVPNVPNEVQTGGIEYATNADHMYYNNDTSAKIIAVGFISSLGQYNGGNLLSGSQQVNLLPIPISAVGVTLADQITNYLRTVGDTTPYNPTGGIQLCFESGTTRESGLITIGGPNSATSVNLQRFSTNGCS